LREELAQLAALALLCLLPLLAAIGVYSWLAPTDFWQRLVAFFVSLLSGLLTFLVECFLIVVRR